MEVQRPPRFECLLFTPKFERGVTRSRGWHSTISSTAPVIRPGFDFVILVLITHLSTYFIELIPGIQQNLRKRNENIFRLPPGNPVNKKFLLPYVFLLNRFYRYFFKMHLLHIIFIFINNIKARGRHYGYYLHFITS